MRRLHTDLFKIYGVFKSNNNLPFLNADGFSLIQVVISIGLMGILALVFVSMLISQSKQIRLLNQKSEYFDIKNSLLITLQNSAICSCQVSEKLIKQTDEQKAKDRASLRFDSTKGDGSQFLILERIKAGCEADAPELVSVGKHYSSGFEIESIRLAQLKPTRVANEWIGEWTIQLKPGSTVIPLQPIRLHQRLQIDPDDRTDAKTVQYCIGHGKTQLAMGEPDFDSGWVYFPWEGAPGTQLANRRSPLYSQWTEHDITKAPTQVTVNSALMEFKQFDKNTKLKGDPKRWKVVLSRQLIDINSLTSDDLRSGSIYYQLMDEFNRGNFPEFPDRLLTIVEEEPVVAGRGFLPGRLTSDSIKIGHGIVGRGAQALGLQDALLANQLGKNGTSQALEQMGEKVLAGMMSSLSSLTGSGSSNSNGRGTASTGGPDSSQKIPPGKPPIPVRIRLRIWN